MPENHEFLMLECLESARQAGEIIRAAWEKPHDLKHKGAIDLVTETDFAVQERLRRTLGEILPEAGFMGEEDDGIERKDARLCWIVDPVDGTTNFVHRIPFVATSIALCEDGRPILGIVNAPMLSECFYAERGKGAFLNGRPIHVSQNKNLTDCLVGTGFPYEVKPQLSEILQRLANVLPVSQGLRRLGAAALDLAYVACGRLDVFYEKELKPWDMAAGWLLAEEAGGTVTNLEGAPLKAGDPVLASNGLVHEEAGRLMKI